MPFPTHLRRVTSLLAAAVTVAALCATLSACRGQDLPSDETAADESTAAEATAPATETEESVAPEPDPAPAVIACPAIPGDGSRFADDAQKESWEAPLAKLLSNVLIPYGEGGEIMGYTPSLDENAPAVPNSYCCGLLDVTADGTPELLVYPLGGGGSSGNAFYYVYDIVTGQLIGDMSGGHEQSWCYYYDTEADECRLYGQFWWRMGWSGRERFVQRIVCLDQPQPYASVSYLFSSHTIEAVTEIDPDGSEIWNEVYTHTDYWLNGDRVSLDDYYGEYDRFVTTCIRLPETALTLHYWSDVADEDDGYEERGAKMAYALTHSEQTFLTP